ncbi:Aspartate--tRNA ligase 2, cytoplasmic [Sarracenia purpurea var. burkii]
MKSLWFPARFSSQEDVLIDNLAYLSHYLFLGQPLGSLFSFTYMKIFRQFLLSEGFVEIRTPKLNAGSSEGGSAVFKLDYKGHSACLAQSPQLHKQMAICGDCGRIFEIGPVFRAEDSYTQRHLCEFTGLDVEMEIKEHYSEVMDVVDRLFVMMFDSLNERCQKELEAIGKQYPFEPLKDLQRFKWILFPNGFIFYIGLHFSYHLSDTHTRMLAYQKSHT